MTDSTANSSSSLQVAREINERCDRFEASWKQGTAPRIEDFLLDVSGTTRRRLLEELLLLEVFWRKKSGQSPEPSDYANRFAELPIDELAEIIGRGLAEFKTSGSTRGNEVTLAAESTASRPTLPRLRYFGDYEILEQIARGGMGVVFKARQISLNRLVAVKMILSGQFASEAQVKRFRSEAESAARLDHPNIVSIYEVGEHGGDHYFSMALVEGTSLATQLSSGPMEARRAAEVVAQVSQAIDYAHGKGVIHRDLKPSNILIDAAGRPRITDFGLAKRVSDADGMTMSGDVLGTPSYMPPEQAAGKIDAVGPASDVYALGAVLYALLAGRPPFQAASSMDTLRQVVDQEPARLRQLNTAIPRDLETIAQKCLEKSVTRRYSSAAALAADLENFLTGRPILARPTTRVERTWRWCKRNPVVASSVALAALLLITVTVVTSVAYRREAHLRITVTNQSHSLSQALSRETVLKDEAIAGEKREAGLRTIAQDAQRKTQEQAQLLLERSRELANTLYNSDLNRVEEFARAGNMERVEALLRRHIPQTPDDEDLRDIEWYYWWRYSHQDRTQVRLPFEVEKVAVSPDNKTLAVGVSGGKIWLWDLANMERRPISLDINHKHFSSLDFGADSTLRAAGWNGDSRGWNLEKGYQTFANHQDPGNSPSKNYRTPVAISPDGKLIVGPAGIRGGVALNGTEMVHELATGMYFEFWTSGSNRRLIGRNYRSHPVAGAPDFTGMLVPDVSRGIGPSFVTENDPNAPPPEAWGSPVFGAAWSHTGTRFAGGNREGRVYVYDIKPLRLAHTLDGHQGIVWAVAFSPDGQQLATGGEDSQVIIWDLKTGAKRTVCTGHQRAVRALAWLPGGKHLASGGTDGAIRVWDVVTGQESLQLRGHAAPVSSLAAAGGGLLISGSADRSVRTWDATPRKDKILTTGTFFPTLMTVSQDESVLCVAESMGGVRIFNPRKGEYVGELQKGLSFALDLALTPDGKTLAFAGLAEIAFWDIATRQTKSKKLRSDNLSGGVGRGAFQNNPKSVQYSPDGKLFAVLADRGVPAARGFKTTAELSIYDAETLDLIERQLVGDGIPALIRFAPDSTRLAAVFRSRVADNGPGKDRLLIMDVVTNEVIIDRDFELPITAIAWSHDGQRLALGSGISFVGGKANLPDVQIVSAESLQIQEVVTGHRNPVSWLGFTRDDQQLIFGADSCVNTWSFKTKELSRKEVESSGSSGIVLANSNMAAISTSASKVSVLPWTEGAELHALRVPGGPVMGISISDDSRLVGAAVTPIAARSGLEWKSYYTVPVTQAERDADKQQPSGDVFQLLSPHGLAGSRYHLFDVLALKTLAPRAASLNSTLNNIPQLSGVLYAAKGHRLPLIATALDTNHVVVWKQAEVADQHPYKPLFATPLRSGILEFSPDDEQLAVAVENRIQIWDRFGKKQNELGPFEHKVRDLAWSPDGRTLAVALRERAEVVEIASGKRLLEIGGHQGQIHTISFSPRGRTLLTGGDDGLIVCHDARDGEMRCRLSGHRGRINDLALAADGRLLASAGEDGSIGLWPLASQTEVQGLANAKALEIDPNEKGLADAAPENPQRGRTLAAVKLLIDRGLSLVGDDQDKPVYVGKPARTEISPTFEPRELFVPGNLANGQWERGDGVQAPTDAECQSIGELKTLVVLNLRNCPISVQGLKSLQGLPLKHLSLARTKVEDFDVAAIFPGETLIELDLSHTPITERTVDSLGKVTSLQTLSLTGVRISPKSLEALAGLRELQSLSLNDTGTTDGGLVYLQGLSLLRTLNLANCAITDDGLDSLAKLPSITWVNVVGTKVTLAGIRKFQTRAPQAQLVFSDEVGEGEWVARAVAKGWGNMRPAYTRAALWNQIDAGRPLTQMSCGISPTVLFLSNARVSHSYESVTNKLSELDVRMIEAIPTLESLSTINVLEEQVPRLLANKKLTHLQLHGPFGDQCLKQVGAMQSLESLSLKSSSLTPAALDELKPLHGLQALSLDSVPWKLTDIVGIFPNLTTLRLSKMNVTNADAEQLLKLPQLTSLKLGSKSLTDECVPTLRQLRKLKDLDLRDTSVTSRGKQRLEDSLPDVRDVD